MIEAITSASDNTEHGETPYQRLGREVERAREEGYKNIYCRRLLDPVTQDKIANSLRQRGFSERAVHTAMELFSEKVKDAMLSTPISTKVKDVDSHYRHGILRKEGRYVVGIAQPRTLPSAAMSMIEAHEAGHRIRLAAPMERLMKGAADTVKSIESSVLSGVNNEKVRKERSDQLGSAAGAALGAFLPDMMITALMTGGTPVPIASILAARVTFLRARPYNTSPVEIVERMAQLKNYFGIVNGSVQFTHDHLMYARDHYIRDVYDNNMKTFFSLITPETEETFIDNMNTLGI